MDSCTVSLSIAAGSSGFAVGLVSNSAAVAVPTSVIVAAGTTSASFSATVAAVNTAQTATIMASAGGVTKTLALQLNAAVPTLSVNTSPLNFANVAVGTATSQSITLSSTGTAPVIISSTTLTGAGFSISGATLPLTLNPGQSATLTVQFTPVAAGPATGQLNIVSNSSAGSTVSISLSGAGVPVLTGLTCVNASATGASTDTCTVSLNVAAPNNGFTIGLTSSSSSVTLPATVAIAPNAMSASFSASIASVSSAQVVTLSANAGTISIHFNLQLNAAVPTLSINATSIAFGNVEVNTTATQSLTLTSTGSAPVTIGSATLTGSGFSYTGISFPITLNPKQTAILSVEFNPSVAGAATSQLAINSNSSSSSNVGIGLSGTGTTTAYLVTVAWNAPLVSSDPVISYHVYRSPSGNSSYQLVTSTNNSQLSFTDSTVQNGQSYDYLVESVDASGNESSPSNIATVAVP